MVVIIPFLQMRTLKHKTSGWFAPNPPVGKWQNGDPTLIHLTPQFLFLAPQVMCWPTWKLYLKVGKVSRKIRKSVSAKDWTVGHILNPLLSVQVLIPSCYLFFCLMPHCWFFYPCWTSWDPSDFLVASEPHGGHWHELSIWLNQGLRKDIKTYHFILNPGIF